MIGDILQPTHLLFVLVVALLVLGPKRLPEVARQLGNGLRDFRAAISGEERHEREPSNEGLTHEEPRADEDMSAFHSDPADLAEPAADAVGARSEPARTVSEPQQDAQPPAPQQDAQPPAPQQDAQPPAPQQDAVPATPQPVAPTDKPA